MKHGKKYQDSVKLIDHLNQYDPDQAAQLVVSTGKAKFDETVEVSIRLGVDPRHADQQVRGAVVLPHGTGRSIRVLVIAKGAKADEARAAGADYVGDQDMITKIQTENWFDFDVCVATPDMMGLVGRIGRVLGPKGLMPNPKSGTVTMDVTFTGSWYDETLEKEGAEKLIQGGCKLISQHADSLGAPTACENAGVPNVSYNGSTQAACPNTYIISSRINWAPYYENAIKDVMDGTAIDTDWTGTLATNSVVLTDLNTTVAAEGTAEAIAAATEKLEKGEIHVFDCSTFTTKADDTMNAFKVDYLKVDADGHITSYMADVDTDQAYAGDTEVVHDGYFAESEKRSAPYFDLEIDGITRLDTKM